MLHKFPQETPSVGCYDCFSANGDYIGYCDYCEDDKWYPEYGMYAINNVAFYIDDHDDWLKMICGLLEKQEQK